MLKKLRIATRNSPLALWQAEFVKSKLCEYYPALTVELIGMTTRGDQILDRSLSKVGGKGLFIKELEHALLNKTADIAVHSMKDVTVDFPEGLALTTILKRHDCRDAFVSNHFGGFTELPANARVGTSSLRRQTQLKALRPDLQWLDLRGNVNTRLQKLDDGQFDAIILATAGLERLGLAERIKERLETTTSLPAAGQGAIGIEARANDDDILQLLKPLEDALTTQCVQAERAVNRHLGGGCQVPIAAYAWIEQQPSQQVLELHALVGQIDGKKILRSQGVIPLTGQATEDSAAIEQLGLQVAVALKEQGAEKIISSVYGIDG